MRVSRNHILSCVALGVAFAATAEAAPVLTDSFTSGAQIGSGPITGVASVANWYIASNNTAMAGSAGGPTYYDAPKVASGAGLTNALKVNNLGAFYDWKANFAGTTLANGDSVSISFNVATSNGLPLPPSGTGSVLNPSGSNGFRVGLFTDGGTSQTSNLGTFASSTFNDDQGYWAAYTPNATATTTTAVSVQDRSGGGDTNGLFQGTLSTVTSTPVTGGAVVANTIYPVTFTITRSLDGSKNTITSSFAGASIAADDTTSPYTSFNQIGIFFGSGWGAPSNQQANYIDDVVVTYTPVPEPTTLAALAGMALLGMKRRRA